jgi:lambda family phage portal protein
MSSQSWYNTERVAQKGSVVLAKWHAERAEKRAREQGQAGQRAYAGAAYNRLTGDWTALNTSADSEIVTALRALRARSRELVRDNAFAKNAIRIIQNNVVGVGIRLQAQVSNARGKLVDSINDQIEREWEKWCQGDQCHAGGKLDFNEVLRMAIGRVAEDGEFPTRLVAQTFGESRVPLGLEVFESDRIIDQWQTAQAPNGNAIRMGVEQNEWGRPTAYWLYPYHPGDYQFRNFVASKFIRVPAAEMLHIYIVDRWPQSRGVPWLHAIIRRLNDMRGYGDAEIVAARAGANIVGFIRTPELPAGEPNPQASPEFASVPGTFRRLLPGEDFVGFNPSRPNAAFEAFMRFMLREIAAGIGCSYEGLSRDYSQSNYSSSRLAALEDRILWRILQGWLICKYMLPIYYRWLDAAVLSGVLNIPDYYSNRDKYRAVRMRPPGWSWIDPTKEVAAYKQAVRSGFMTVGDVIGQTGGGADAEDIFKARRAELDMMSDLNLVFDTDPGQTDDKGKEQGTPTAEAGDGNESSSDPVPAEGSADNSENSAGADGQTEE